VFIVLAHDRRRVLHVNVTEHPTAAWTAQQIIETFPDETAPRFLLRDRDQIYGEEFRRRVAGMKIEEVITAARSPWQNAYVERLIGSIRRECLDHVIILGENHLRRILRSYFGYYHSSRTHLSLCKDAPEPRAKQPPECGLVIEIAEVGGERLEEVIENRGRTRFWRSTVGDLISPHALPIMTVCVQATLPFEPVTFARTYPSSPLI
jgi:putative transposase